MTEHTANLALAAHAAAAMATGCEWFARCTRPATGYTFHSILGEVPTCDECHAFASPKQAAPQPAAAYDRDVRAQRFAMQREA